MTKKSNIGLVEHCQRALTEQWGYVNGGYCSVLTQTRYDTMICDPDVNKYNYKNRSKIKPFIGEMISDCYGLLKGYVWWNLAKGQASYRYNDIPDRNQQRAFSDAKSAGNKWGEIKTLSANYKPGIVVWLDGHAGIAVNKLPNGDVEVIECRGHYPSMRKGIVKASGAISGTSRWTHWFEDTYIDYTSASAGREEGKVKYFTILGNETMNLRATAPNGTIIGPIPAGTIISGSEFLTAPNGTVWMGTSYNGKAGWVAVGPDNKGYCKEVPAPVTPPVQPTPDLAALLKAEQAKTAALTTENAALKKENEQHEKELVILQGEYDQAIKDIKTVKATVGKY